ncbi:MAG: DNA polymerase IV [Acidimicrobiia bacterium]|nr:MAG: DNA polymerase IV [Acidimicrobiia bacterium]
MDIAGILHADLDAFYAAVAVLEDPALEGKPVAVGTGVVLSCTYEAREFGVRGGMRMVDARALCPKLIEVDGTFGAYPRYSRKVFAIFESYTPQVEPLSIDEAFLDITGSIHLFGSPGEIADKIRSDVRSVTGLAVSVGASARKFLSKIASQVAKPDGVIVVEPGKELEFLHPLPVSYLWGVGPVTKRKLNELGLKTIGDIAETPDDALVAMIGSGAAGHLGALAHNLDPRPVLPIRKAKSVGAQSAMRSKRRSLEDLVPVLQRLTDRVAARLREKDRSARTVTVRVRFGDLSSVTRSATMPTPTASTQAIVDVASGLLKKVLEEYPKHETSLLGISTSGLGVDEPLQLALGVDDATTGGTPKELEYEALDEFVDELRRKYGRSVITHGSDLLSGRSTFGDGLSDVMTPDERLVEAADSGPTYVEVDEGGP